MDIGVRLKNISCIFLQEDKTFVKANQLVFKLRENSLFKPFLFPVPHELLDCEHFLKRLGATKKPTLLQIAFVLNSIHQDVGEEAQLDSTKLKIVKYAMYRLFKLLYRSKSADGINELYLPSQDKKLLKSCEMVCKVSPRFTEVIEKCQYPILLRFEECKLRKVADGYIDALPEHLRPKKFDEIVREEVDPECKISVCSEARHGSICSFQEHFQNLLQSDEFQEGLQRLLLEDTKNPQEFEQIMRKLQTDVEFKCIGVEKVKISFIDRHTNEVLGHFPDSCYAVQEEETWHLYMQHDFKDDKTLASTAECVNKILGDCIRRELVLAVMLDCSCPSQIANKLDKRDIPSATKADGDAELSDDISEWDSDDERDDVKESGRTRMNGGRIGCATTSGGGMGGGIGGGIGGGMGGGMGGGAGFPDGGYGVGYRRRGGCGGHSR
jgi:hypothetical protein